MWSEIRGDRDVNAFGRRVPTAVIRQALTVAILSVTVVLGSAAVLTATSSFDFLATLFESTSAFATVGLSTGITPELPAIGQLLLVLVMLTGRVGPTTFVAALALRERNRVYRYAEERPIIG